MTNTDNFLNHEQETALFKLLHHGNEAEKKDAELRLFKSQFLYVCKMASAWKCSFLTTEDMKQAGFMGLIHAIRTFKPRKSYTLLAYSKVCIRSAMCHQAAKQNGLIRLPYKKYNKEHYPFQLANLDTDMGSGDTLADLIEDEEAVSPDANLNKQEANADMLSLLKKLHPRCQKIIIMHLGLNGDAPLTLKKIATLLKSKKSTVREAYKRGLRQLRKIIGEK